MTKALTFSSETTLSPRVAYVVLSDFLGRVSDARYDDYEVVVIEMGESLAFGVNDEYRLVLISSALHKMLNAAASVAGGTFPIYSSAALFARLVWSGYTDVQGTLGLQKDVAKHTADLLTTLSATQAQRERQEGRQAEGAPQEGRQAEEARQEEQQKAARDRGGAYASLVGFGIAAVGFVCGFAFAD